MDGAELYVANVEDGLVSVIDTATWPRSPVSWSVPHPFRSASRPRAIRSMSPCVTKTVWP
ncbi:hypothetical protein [Paracoccus sp. Z118]|uniref:hypothetical protein n=1 Tax=Paracoccus sp. Z118 TaxID=2851017 RepID=UPI0020B77AEA|nr:hypothetical protein [Paracoccus sp. Z118]